MKQNALIEMTPQSERPRERCLETGASCLSLRECLALILGSGPREVGCMGLAHRILTKPGNGFNEIESERIFFSSMETSGRTHLTEISGLGPAGQARLLAAFELARRYTLYRYSHHRIQNRTKSLSHLAIQALEKIPATYRIEAKEWLGFIPIHQNSGIVGDLCLVEKGVRTHVNVDPAELFARILALRPMAFFLVHNHPSGSTLPSWQDRDLTTRVGKISGELGVQLLGHWIVTPQTEKFLQV